MSATPTGPDPGHGRARGRVDDRADTGADRGEHSEHGDRMIEPVHWGARLAVVDDAHYTEVGGTAVAVLADTARVVRLTGDMAALVTRLDGRPVHDALGDLLAGWDDAERRRVIELLRRCKTLGLLRDMAAGTPPSPVDWSAAVPPAASVDLRATVEPADAPTGAATRAGRAPTGARIVFDRPWHDGPGGQPERAVGPAVGARSPAAGPVTLDRGPDGAVNVRVTDGSASPITGFVLPPATATDRLVSGRVGTGIHPVGPSEIFGFVVESVDPADQLRDATVVELCALLADTIPAERTPAGP